MNENVQLGNASQEAPESAGMSSEGFFEALDTQVNGGILDAPASQEQKTSQSLEDAGNQFLQEQQQKESPVEAQADVENLQKRYSDSSREAKRLSGRLNEVEPYMPILDAMREDPNLVSHVRTYFEGGGQTPVSMKEQLNLNEDFVFDPDEAMSKPDSDSAKVLSATIDGVVQKRLNDALSTQKNENQRLTKESEFRSKFNLSDSQWTEFLSFAKNKTLQLDDIYYLMNRGQREQNIAQSANQEVTNQMKKVQQRPQSLASTGSASEPQKSPDDSVFEEILGIDTTLDSVLGL
jgi:hypothetical protein|tara:strand:+ start:2984 stop:3862 length:879 start_codon:yes stop_codon:yes gene_type:complete